MKHFALLVICLCTLSVYAMQQSEQQLVTGVAKAQMPFSIQKTVVPKLFSVSLDGKTCVAQQAPSTVSFRNLETNEREDCALPSSMTACALYDNKTAFIGMKNGTIEKYVAKGPHWVSCGKRILEKNKIPCSVISSNKTNQYAVALHNTPTIEVYSSSSFFNSHTLKGHKGGTTHLLFSNDGKKIYSAGRDNAVALWDLETIAQLYVMKSDTNKRSRLGGSSITACDIDKGSDHVITGHDDGTVCLWDIRTSAQYVEQLSSPIAKGRICSVHACGDQTYVTHIIDRNTDTSHLELWKNGSYVEMFMLPYTGQSYAYNNGTKALMTQLLPDEIISYDVHNLLNIDG